VAVIGSSDLDVLPIALGTNTFGWTADRDESFEILDAFVAGGGRLVDTADVYSAWVPGNSGGESEAIIGEWIASRGGRDQLVVATKVSSHPDYAGLGAANIAAAARQSLRRLQTDHIDLYLAHVDDPDTPLEETVSAFAELVDGGAVRYVGLSNYTPDRIVEWIETAQRLGVAAPVALEPHYNLLRREPFESGLSPLAARHDLGVLPYYGLAAGFLTGKYRSPEDADGVARGSMVAAYLTDAGFAAADEVRAIAQQRGVAPASVALAWLRTRPTVVAPIAGATKVEQVPPLLAAATLELDATELDRLERVSDAFAPAEPMR
jgi:aryl-alcohol dehydrogenase-like predicted oxidoreductase